MIELLAAGLPLTLLVNWPVFVVCFVVARRHPGIRTLIDRRWISLGIAAASTALTVVAIAFFVQFRLGAELMAVLFAGPVYVLTVVNAVFLWLTWKGQW